jgi:PmbA/TldA metallopeptidase C-terminal domain
MNHIAKRTAGLVMLVCAIAFPGPLRAADDLPMKAMRDEMARSTGMQLPGLARPYFIAYRIQDINDVSIAASLGSLVTSQRIRSRLLHVELRVGDYKLDNTNFLSFGNRQVGGFSAGQQIAIDDDYREIRRQIWLATDSEYKKAVGLLAAKQAALQNQNHGEDVPDFSRERPNKYFEKDKLNSVDVSVLEAAARQVSTVFRQMPEAQSSQVTINAHHVYTRYLNSEGTEYAKADEITFVEIKATTHAKDGLPLNDTEQIFLKSPSDLSSTELAASAQQIVTRLEKLRTAGSFDRYNGPVLFEGEAGAEIFAQLFAPALVASRDPVTDNPRAQAFLEQMTARFGGGTLNDRIGGRVLPDFVTLVDNPRLDSFHGQQVMGAYSVDEDGVPARVNTVVESGILKLVLTSRTPIAGATQSTGSHRGMSAAPSNLIFSASKSATEQELRRMLLDRAKARGFPYGVIVRRADGSGNELIQAAMSMMQGGGPAGNNMLEVYKLYADGHEELMHGEQLPSMTAVSFKDIVAVGDKPVVYNAVFIPGFSSLMMLGMSGDISAVTNMPLVSYIVPSLLFEEVTLKKAPGPFPNPPVTKPPELSTNGG